MIQNVAGLLANIFSIGSLLNRIDDYFVSAQVFSFVIFFIVNSINFIDLKMDKWKVHKRFVDTRGEPNDQNAIEYKLLNWLDELKNDEHYGAK